MKKTIYRMMLILCLFITVIFTVMYVDKTVKTDPYEHLVNIKSEYPVWVPTEFLYMEQVEDNLYLVFYKNKNRSMTCALIKKLICFYRVLDYSGEISFYSHKNRWTNQNERVSLNYSYCSELDRWIYWGAVYDDTVNSVIIEGRECNIINIDKYNVRICWFLDDAGKADDPGDDYILN